MSLTLRPPQILFTSRELLDGRGMAGASLTLRPPQFLSTSLELLEGRGVPDSASSAVSQYIPRATGWQGLPCLCVLRSFSLHLSGYWMARFLEGFPESAPSAITPDFSRTTRGQGLP